jgi:hypothetical protein
MPSVPGRGEEIAGREEGIFEKIMMETFPKWISDITS